MFSPLKVLVSPFKTFKEMTQNPQVKGLIVLIALLLAATAGTQYASASKVFLRINTQPTSLLASNMFAGYMISSLVDIAIIFFANWIIYAGALFLLIRAFGEKGGRWRSFFILVGYVFSVFIIRMGVTAALILTLPNLPVAISTWPPATENDYTTYINQVDAIWTPTLASQVASFLTWIFYGWFVILGVAAVHASVEITRGKAAMISVGAYLINFILSSFLRVML